MTHIYILNNFLQKCWIDDFIKKENLLIKKFLKENKKERNEYVFLMKKKKDFIIKYRKNIEYIFNAILSIVDAKKKNKFHKSEEMRDIWNEIFEINNWCYEKTFVEDYIYKKIAIEIYIKNKLGDINKKDYNKESKINIHRDVYEEIKKSMLIITSSTKEKMIIKCLFKGISQVCMEVSDNVDVENCKLDFPIIDLDMNKEKPFILLNKYLEIDDFEIGDCFGVGDNILNPIKIVKNNVAYGSIDISNNRPRKIKNKYRRNSFWGWCKKFYGEFCIINKNECLNLCNEIRKRINFKEEITDIKEFRDTIISRKDVSQDIIKIILLELYLKDKNDDVGFYYKSFHDFRGRKYYNSIISITNFPEIRSMLKLPKYSKENIDNIIRKSIKTKAHEIIIKLWEKKYDENMIENNHEIREYRKSIILFCLKTLGMIFKKDMLINKSSIQLKEIIEKGFDIEKNIKNGIINLEKIDIKDGLKIKKLLKIIKIMRDNKENVIDMCEKEIINLDFSCSGHQIRYSDLEPLEEITYKNLNMSGDDQYTDIYSLIINMFKKKMKDENISEFEKNDVWNIINKYFNRKNLKKSIMTCEYNVKIPKFIEYFRDEVKKSTSYIDKINERMGYEWKMINYLMTKLYKICNDLSECEDFKCKKNLKNNFEILKRNGYIMILEDGFILELAVFKKEKSDRRITIIKEISGIKKRITTKLLLYTNVIDNKATKDSFVPNYVHSQDAIITRKIKNWNDEEIYYSIHDEFLIPYQESLIFVDKINKILNKERKMYNICIIN